MTDREPIADPDGPVLVVDVFSSGVTYNSSSPSSMIRFAAACSSPIRFKSVLAMIKPVSSIMLMFCPTIAPISVTICMALC